MKPVFEEKVTKIFLVEDFDVYIGIQLPQPSHFPVLLCNQVLAHGGELYINIKVREVKVWGKALDDITLSIPFDGKSLRLIKPLNLIKVQYLGTLFLAGVGEVDFVYF